MDTNDGKHSDIALKDKIRAIVDKATVDKKLKIEVETLSSPNSLSRVNQWIPSGIFPLDLAVGRGLGTYPVRRIIEIFGDYSSGKTLLAAQAAAATQEIGGLAVYADCEAAIDLGWMKTLGINAEQLIYITPDTVNEVFSSIDRFIALKNDILGVDVPMTFIWDSVSSVATMEELEADSYEKRSFPSAARALSGAFRKSQRTYSRGNLCLLLINQIRSNIGANMWEDDYSTYGGKAISFYASIRLYLKRSSKIKNREKKTIGMWVSAQASKNKLAPPLAQIKFPIYYDYGIDEAEAILDLLKDMKLVNSFGGRWRFDNDAFIAPTKKDGPPNELPEDYPIDFDKSFYQKDFDIVLDEKGAFDALCQQMILRYPLLYKKNEELVA